VTRAYVRLLGPCFKTGRLKPFRQDYIHLHTAAEHMTCTPNPHTHCTQSAHRSRATNPHPGLSLIADVNFLGSITMVPVLYQGAITSPRCRRNHLHPSSLQCLNNHSISTHPDLITVSTKCTPNTKPAQPAVPPAISCLPYHSCTTQHQRLISGLLN
jgi:hypothetical protein